MEIDRRAFFAGLGGVAAVAAMADEAKAEALEHHMMLQLNVANQAATDKKFPTAAEVAAQIETQPSRRGTQPRPSISSDTSHNRSAATGSTA